jgi:hypothetical protein
MAQSPLFSVCLLAHNSAKFIRTAIESVLAQTETDWELIIADDASQDETFEIIKAYLDNPKIRCFRHETNIRQAANWWSAIQNAEGNIITTLHADDAYLPEALRMFRNAFNQDAVELVWAKWWRCDANLQPLMIMPDYEANKFTGQEACVWLVMNNHALPSASAFRSELSKKTGSPDNRLGMLCDRDYFLRLSRNAKNCRSLANPAVWYRVHEKSVTADFSSSGKLRNELVAFPKIAHAYLSDQPRLLNELKKSSAREVFRQGTMLILCGKAAEGHEAWNQAIKLKPDVWILPKNLFGRMLTFFGPLGIRLARYLHRSSLSS